MSVNAELGRETQNHRILVSLYKLSSTLLGSEKGKKTDPRSHRWLIPKPTFLPLYYRTKQELSILKPLFSKAKMYVHLQGYTKEGVRDPNLVETLTHTGRGSYTTASWTGPYLCLYSGVAISHVTPILSLGRRLTLFA